MASNLLWAHLLRKDATTSETPSQIPPSVPQDKVGTSMRMLIHDTQANLEKFSARLDGLLQRVDDCRGQVVNANKLLDVERDKVLSEILEIANRCQSEMKAHVGTPAQATALDLVHVSQVSTEKSVQALEKRIDALQALLQTHVHVMQAIQDQQNSLIGAILPLVPVLHGVPSQIDQIKAAASDMMANTVSTMASSIESIRSTLIAELAHCAGSSTRVGSSSKPISSSRRKRSDASVLGAQETNVLSSPLSSRAHGGPHHCLKRARVEGTVYHADNVDLPRKLSRLADPSHSRPLLQTPKTPRRPLADLHLHSGSHTSMVHHRMVSHRNSKAHEYMRGPCTISRAPFQSLEHARPDLQDSTVTRRHSAALHDGTVELPSAAGPSDQDVLSKAIKVEEILEPKLSGVFSIHSSPLSSPPLSPRPVTRDPRGVAQEHLRLRENVPQVALAEVPPPLYDPITSSREASPPKSMSLRDRRAQMSMFGRTETRRFIPLVPWSDEEE